MVSLDNLLKSVRERGLASNTPIASPVIDKLWKEREKFVGNKIKFAYTVSNKDGNKEVEIEPKYCVAVDQLTLPEELLSTDESAAYSLVKAKVENIEIDIKDYLSMLLYGDGSGEMDPTLDSTKSFLIGKDSLVVTNGSSEEQVDGDTGEVTINGPIWLKNDSKDDFIGLEGMGLIESDLGIVATFLKAKRKMPNVSVLMSPTLFERICADQKLQANLWQKRAQLERRAKMLGVNKYATAQGNAFLARVILDPYCPDERIYFVDLDALKLIVNDELVSVVEGAGENGPEKVLSWNVYGNFVYKAAPISYVCTYNAE